MSPLLLPFQLVLLMFAGWVNRHQLDLIEYLQEENRVLKERLGGRRPRFTDAERCRLARKAQSLGREVLNELETLVTRYCDGTGNWWHANGTTVIGVALEAAHQEDNRRYCSADGG
jgi:hypothetical protein